MRANCPRRPIRRRQPLRWSGSSPGHILPALSPGSLLYRHSSSLTRLIANWSYAIYLTHKQLIHLTHEALKPFGIDNDSYTSFWICVAVCLLGGWLLHIVVERPFLRLRDHLLKKPLKEQIKVAPPL